MSDQQPRCGSSQRRARTFPPPAPEATPAAADPLPPPPLLAGDVAKPKPPQRTKIQVRLLPSFTEQTPNT